MANRHGPHEQIPQRASETGPDAPASSSTSPASGGIEQFPNNEPKPPLRSQFIATLVSCLSAIVFGTVLGYSSPTMAELRRLLTLDDGAVSWHASISTIGAMFGGPVGGVCLEKFGRKLTIVACGVPYVLGWFLIMLVLPAKSFPLLLTGRLLTGIAMGVVCIATPTYIAEIATSNTRGTLCNLFQVSIALGVLLCFVLGPPTQFFWLALLCAIIAACMSVGVFFIPESPIYLSFKGHETQALASLKWLRGTAYDYNKEYHNIMAAQNTQSAERPTLGELFTDNSLRKPIIITLFLMVFQQFSGINDFIFYTTDILKNAAECSLNGTTGINGTNGTNGGEGTPGMDPKVASIIIAVGQAGTVLVSIFAMDLAGRRILLSVSSTFMTIACITIGLFYQLQKDGTCLSWLPLFSIVLFGVAWSFGWGPVPWTMMAEILPARVEGFGCGLAVCTNWACAFMVTKTFPDMRATLTSQGTYWFFAGINAVGMLITLLFVPETRGKSLAQIQEGFAN